MNGLERFSLLPGGSIECDPPVKNKKGDKVKRVTTPDFQVYDEVSDRVMYVEVTKVNGDTPHKKAQRRVVEQAGVDNYIVLTGAEIQLLQEIADVEEVESLLTCWFGWEMDG